MAIKKDTEEKKNGMKVTDNMDGDKNADKKIYGRRNGFGKVISST